MHEWPDAGTPQLNGWVIPESRPAQHPEPTEGQPASGDQVPVYSHAAPSQLGYDGPPPSGPPLAYGPAPAYGPPPGYGSPPAYGPPQAYPSQGQPGYPGTPAVAPWLVAQPAKRSRAKVVAIVCSALVAGILVLAVVLASVSRQNTLTAASHTLTLPAASGPYVRITTETATRLGQDLVTQVKASGSVLWTKPVVGIYGLTSTGSPAAVFIGGDAVSNPHLRTQLHDTSQTLFIDGFMAGAHMQTTTSFPAGKFGGILRCGPINGTQTACVWVDGSTIGTLVLITPQSLQAAAGTALAFREATEH